jgi:hypothetical protein
MKYEALKATAQSLQRLCNAVLQDIEQGTLSPYAVHEYLHDLETGDNSIYAALELTLEGVQDAIEWGY